MGGLGGHCWGVCAFAPVALLFPTPLTWAQAADWNSAYWSVVPNSSGAEKRSAPIRTIVRDVDGRLLGTRPSGSAIELWRSANNGVDWSRLPNVASSDSVIYGDSTLVALASGELLVGYREQHPTLGWSVRVSRSVDHGATWNFGGTIHDWTGGEFVGAPAFNVLSDGTLQAYYDSEAAAPGSDQYIALKSGAFNSQTGLWEWSNERIVNRTGVGGAGVRDGMATVVNLGPDLDGVGERLMVVVEGIGVTGGQAHNVVRAFQVQNGGATQADWDAMLDSRVVYQSRAIDLQAHRYNAYAPFALKTAAGPVVVAFSTDEVLSSAGLPADAASAPVGERHSEVKFTSTTANFESWAARKPAWGTGHPEFEGSLSSGDIFNYQVGLFELAPNDLLATLDMFDGRQMLMRPSLGGASADFDESGAVDGADFLIWQRGFGLVGESSRRTGDATGEGAVNSADLAKWRVQFGAPTQARFVLNSVPEPSGWQLTAATCSLVAGWKWSRRQPFSARK